MKKLMYIGLALVLSFTIVGLSVAQDGLETKNLTASADSSITRSSPGFGESSEWSDGIFLALTDTDTCLPYGAALCTWIEGICCDSSPVDPNDPFCNKNWNKGMCGTCYHPCD
ncbi:MAG: hypothetical protein ABIN18_29690 [Pseudomonadota bacterium]